MSTHYLNEKNKTQKRYKLDDYIHMDSRLYKPIYTTDR